MAAKQPVLRWQDKDNRMGMRPVQVVAGDIGGTKSWLVWFVRGGVHSGKILFEQRYESASFVDAQTMLRHFFRESGRDGVPDEVLLALPGPVQTQQVRLTNLAWEVDAVALKNDLGVKKVWFVNDFQAAARGVETLHKPDVQIINPGLLRVGGTRVITGAGTGLGLAWMQADDKGKYQIYASEGGHVDFAPANAEQAGLLVWLWQRYPHVSWERLLSGDGLSSIYQYLCQREQGDSPVISCVQRSAADIHALAIQRDALANLAVQWFVDLYAAWIGNVALLYQPRGGLYLAGGMAIHLQNWLITPHFIEIMVGKGRMQPIVREIPVYLVMTHRLGLQGAMLMHDAGV